MVDSYLDIENWNRKEHYLFFKEFDEPFFGVVAEIDCTHAYNFCKQMNIPFFLYYHYKAILALNQIEEFRYRIKDDKIIIFDTIHVTTTINRYDNTFAFSFIPFTRSFEEFKTFSLVEIDNIRNSTGLRLSEDTNRLDVIHFSTVPWINYTGVTHARMFMPVSIHVHHGLMDGFHVGKYLQLFELLMNDNKL